VFKNLLSLPFTIMHLFIWSVGANGHNWHVECPESGLGPRTPDYKNIRRSTTKYMCGPQLSHPILFVVYDLQDKIKHYSVRPSWPWPCLPIQSTVPTLYDQHPTTHEMIPFPNSGLLLILYLVPKMPCPTHLAKSPLLWTVPWPPQISITAFYKALESMWIRTTHHPHLEQTW
jgi:hypothetical protein